MRRSLLVFVSIVLLSFQVSDGQNCECDECIARGIDYQWCLDGENPRCIRSSETCANPENPIIDPVVTRNDAFGSGVQIRPQEQRVQIRPGETKTLDFTFQAGDFPLDLYFLMDLGPMMESHFSRFRTSISNMVSAIQGVTSNVRIGFGTFVDKPVQTFVGEIIYSPRVQCYLDGECFIPHSFVHHINLTDGNDFMNEFDNNAFPLSLETVTRVANGISANASRKENPLNSGLDALAQVAECTQEIGWSETSRKVVVYISNTAFHLSSESWIAGIVRRQDGKCHLKPQPFPPSLRDTASNQNVARNGGFFQRLSDYEAAITQEYASPALVQTKLESNEIVPIFLIEGSQKALYQAFVDTLSQTNAVLFELEENSDNLASGAVLTSTLRAVQSSIRLSPESLSNVEVTVNASCSTDRPNSCDNVMIGQNYTFQASVKVTACTEELRRSALLPISDPFLGSTVLNISSLCECSCSSIRVENSAQCMSRGALTCGCCDCNDSFYGSQCQCEGEVVSCPTVNGLQCSGEGTCDDCNRCNCTTGFYGDMCECSNTTCRRGGVNSAICSGNGDCVCHECMCNQGYTGDACDCSTNTSNCFDDSEEICNGRGNCVCGSCECQDGYVGAQCKFCRSTTDARCLDPCSSYESCIRCRISLDENFQFRRTSEDSCRTQCSAIRVADLGGTPDDTRTCSLSLGACEIQYFIPNSGQPVSNDVLINASPQNCAYPPPPWAFAIAAFIAAVILGIVILLLIKLIIYLLDYMEYKRFEDDVNKTTFGENQNPLYRDPQTEHPNPLFKGKEKPPLDSPSEKC